MGLQARFILQLGRKERKMTVCVGILAFVAGIIVGAKGFEKLTLMYLHGEFERIENMLKEEKQ